MRLRIGMSMFAMLILAIAIWFEYYSLEHSHVTVPLTVTLTPIPTSTPLRSTTIQTPEVTSRDTALTVSAIGEKLTIDDTDFRIPNALNPKIPDEINGYLLAAKAAALITWTDSIDNIILGEPGLSPKASLEDIETMRQFLKENEDAVALLEQSLEMDSWQARDFSLFNPNIRSFGNLLSIQALIRTVDSQYGEAFESTDIMERLGNKLMDMDGSLIYFLVGHAIQYQGMTARTEQIARGMSPEALKDYHELILRHLDDKSLYIQRCLLSLGRDHLLAMEIVQNNKSSGLSMGELEVDGLFAKKLNEPSFVEEHLDSKATWEAMEIRLTEMRKAMSTHSLAEAKALDERMRVKHQNVVARIHEIAQNSTPWPPNIVGDFFASVNSSQTASLISKHHHHHREHQACTIKLAFWAYTGRHGQAPATLEDMVPSHLKAIPTDPITGNTYVLNSDKRSFSIKDGDETFSLE